MRKLILIFMLISMSAIEAYSQISVENVEVKTVGLANEYAKRFKNSSCVQTFVSAWNSLHIDYDVSKIVINVSYMDDRGVINVELDYNPAKHFDIWKYQSHNDQFQNMFAGGISVLFQNEVLTAVTEYKFSVAREGWTIDNRLMKFANAVTLKKTNGDVAIFSGYNYRMTNGAYPFRFYTNVEMKINGKYLSINSQNSKTLNDLAFFSWGETEGLDGKRTKSYYLSEFFNPTENELKALEAEKKLKAEKAAMLQIQREKDQKILKEECINYLHQEISEGKKFSTNLLNQYDCYIDGSSVICERNGIEVAIGKCIDESIRFIGTEQNFIDFLSYCSGKNNIVFTTSDNIITSIKEDISNTYAHSFSEESKHHMSISKHQLDSIAKMFEFVPKRVCLFDDDQSTYNLDTQYHIAIKFSSKGESLNKNYELKVKVQNKKDEMKYKMSIISDNMIFSKKYENHILLNSIKTQITTPGEFSYKYEIQKGNIQILYSLNGENLKVSDKYACYEIELIPTYFNELKKEINCYMLDDPMNVD